MFNMAYDRTLQITLYGQLWCKFFVMQAVKNLLTLEFLLVQTSTGYLDGEDC